MPAAPADRDPDAAVEEHSSIRPACRQPTHPGAEDRIALSRIGRSPTRAGQAWRAGGKKNGGGIHAHPTPPPAPPRPPFRFRVPSPPPPPPPRPPAPPT